MAYWLMKSEPHSYSWDDLLRDGKTEWDGVRNAAARLNLKAMQVGDEGLFYESGDNKSAVGIMQITRTWRPDGPEDAWASVQVEKVRPLAAPVSLKAMKAEPRLAKLETIRQSRLSVTPVRPEEWAVLTQFDTDKAG
jgi:predicted RNA-binding protein with PUA-like domain